MVADAIVCAEVEGDEVSPVYYRTRDRTKVFWTLTLQSSCHGRNVRVLYAVQLFKLLRVCQWESSCLRGYRR